MANEHVDINIQGKFHLVLTHLATASSPGLHALCERTELPARGLEPSAIARGLAKNDKKLPDLGEKLPDFAGGKLDFF